MLFKKGEIVILDFNLDSQKKLIADIWGLYENKYLELQVKLNNENYNRIYFSGSDEMLCVFDPSLINKLQCKWCLKGKYVGKKPRSKTYHTMYFDKDDTIYKIEFSCDVTNNYYDNFKEIFFIHMKNMIVYLVYSTIDKSIASELCGIYILHFDDSLRLSSFVYSPSKLIMSDLSGEINEFKNHNLISTIRYSMMNSKCEKFTFSYSKTGYLKSYQNVNLQIDNPLVYKANFLEKDIYEFEKYGRFYFSPPNKQDKGTTIPMNRIVL